MGEGGRLRLGSWPAGQGANGGCSRCALGEVGSRRGPCTRGQVQGGADRGSRWSRAKMMVFRVRGGAEVQWEGQCWGGGRTSPVATAPSPGLPYLGSWESGQSPKGRPGKVKGALGGDPQEAGNGGWFGKPERGAARDELGTERDGRSGMLAMDTEGLEPVFVRVLPGTQRSVTAAEMVLGWPGASWEGHRKPRAGSLDSFPATERRHRSPHPLEPGEPAPAPVPFLWPCPQTDHRPGWPASFCLWFGPFYFKEPPLLPKVSRL